MIVCTNYAESALALTFDDFLYYDDYVILNTRISLAIGNYFEYNLQMLVVLCIISVAIQTCIFNKLACGYLGINLYEKYFFTTHVYDNEIYYAVCIVNIIVATYLTFKGLKIITKTK